LAVHLWVLSSPDGRVSGLASSLGEGSVCLSLIDPLAAVLAGSVAVVKGAFTTLAVW
jgi:hypothetical protein